MAKKKNKLDWLNIRKALSYFRRLWPFLKPQWAQIALALLGTGMYSGGYAMRLVVIKPFLNLVNDPTKITQADAAGIIQQVAPLSGVLLGGAALMGIGTFLRQYYMGYVQSYTVINLQRAIVDKVLKQPMAFFNSEKKGALMSRMTANTGAASGLVKIVIESVISQPATIVAVLAVLLYTSVTLSLATFVVFPIVLIPVMLFAGKIRKATRKKYQKLEASGDFFMQMLDGIRVVKSYRLEPEQKAEFDRVSEDVFRRDRKVARYKGTARFSVEFTYNALMAAGLFAVGFLMSLPFMQGEGGGLGMFVQFLPGWFSCTIRHANSGTRSTTYRNRPRHWTAPSSCWTASPSCRTCTARTKPRASSRRSSSMTSNSTTSKAGLCCATSTSRSSPG